MKRNYVTPLIAVELYDVTQSIPGCETKINFADEECVKKDSDATPQMKSLAASLLMFGPECLKPAQGMDYGDGICYHTNAQAAFTS